MNIFKKKYLLENEEYLNNLKEGLNQINQISKKLYVFNINIANSPWYKNLIELYVPQAISFYCSCQTEDFYVKEKNDIWMRSSYKSFLSEVEKFIKFIIKCILNYDAKSFNVAINDLNKIVLNYGKYLNNLYKEQIELIQSNLHIWRKNYNENKHDIDKLDDNFYIENGICVIIGDDVLEYVSNFIYEIICPLLNILLIIKESNY